MPVVAHSGLTRAIRGNGEKQIEKPFWCAGEETWSERQVMPDLALRGLSRAAWRTELVPMSSVQVLFFRVSLYSSPGMSV